MTYLINVVLFSLKPEEGSVATEVAGKINWKYLSIVLVAFFVVITILLVGIANSRQYTTCDLLRALKSPNVSSVTF